MEINNILLVMDHQDISNFQMKKFVMEIDSNLYHLLCQENKMIW